MLAPESFSAYLTDDLKWTAVLGRDTCAETAFVYCVKSTKIFCRPTCPSRRPRRENVEFATDSIQAQVMGYRSCQRCLPEGLASPHEARQGIAVAHAQVIIREAVQAGRPVPSLVELAEMVGMSKFYFLRVFKSSVGLTPVRFARNLRGTVRTVRS
ncbi:uncharacterized protein CcaverHIS019_0706140 [Cutaneotrichosporon cavernicola]|uniref:HTH araC/xylS-type domain-containing protein n=1 Tax=Cutaneotrichosporon cavernicola TaxID=279322 RepID=A0AA48LAK7_9TREE|nr:uncharacterized protein CcaverHIS019_0706140 [Cutaneotrichosporon cavernicola]BEI95033.1 hypothetical protein CcaverHIS019_0706140 [Cutaneotrichosporon cavernicola]